MASGDVVFRVTADEAKAIRAFQKIIDAQNKTEKSNRKLGKSSNRTMKAFSRGARNAGADIAGMVGGIASVATAIMVARGAWNLWKQDIADGARALKDFQKEFVNLQFLGESYKDPEFRKRTSALAAKTGIAGGEMAKGVYTLKSMTAYATPERRADMLAYLIQLRKMGSIPLADLVPTFAKMGAIYPNLKGVEQANITQFLIEKAAIKDPAELAAYGPKMFAAGKIGKVGARTAAAVGAFLTAKTGTTAQAATAEEVLFRKVMLSDPSESEALQKLAYGKGPLVGRKKLLEKAGVTSKDNAYERLMKLSRLYGAGEIGAQELKTLFGERGMKYGQIVLEDPQGLQRMRDEFLEKTGAGKDITGTKLATALKTDPVFRMVLAGQKAAVGKEVAGQKPEYLVWDVLEDRIEEIRKKTGRGWFWKKRMDFNVALGKMGHALGYSVEDQAVHVMTEAMAGSEYEVPSGENYYERSRGKARQLLGMDPPASGKITENLNQATQNLLQVTENLLNSQKNRVPSVNAHTE